MATKQTKEVITMNMSDLKEMKENIADEIIGRLKHIQPFLPVAQVPAMQEDAPMVMTNSEAMAEFLEKREQKAFTKGLQYGVAVGAFISAIFLLKTLR